MTSPSANPDHLPIALGDGTWRTDPLRLAIAAYLARYRGETRRHAESTCVSTSPGANCAD